MLFRFLFISLVIYLGYRFFKGFWEKTSSKDQIKGQQKNMPLNLHDEDVEDARFEDVEDDERDSQ